MASDEEYEYEYGYEYEYSDDDGEEEEEEEDRNSQKETDNVEEPHSSTDSSTDTDKPNAPPHHHYTISNNSRNNHNSNNISSSSSSHDDGVPSSSFWITQKPAAVRFLPAIELKSELTRRVQEVIEALGVPTAAAIPLLRQHNWSVQVLLQKYSDAPEAVLEEAGVMLRCRTHSNPSTNNSKMNSNNIMAECPICMDDVPIHLAMAMACGHAFCLKCWKAFLQNTILEEGPTCVMTTCPGSSCRQVVTEDEIRTVVPHLLSNFQRYQLRSFVESNSLARWCPGKRCDRVAIASHGVESAGQCMVECDACHTPFCLGCGREPHIPVTCQELVLWDDKNTNESETCNWITANTKRCPKCAMRIHKDGGCQYVICRNCKHGFCWLCMGTHHVWNCNAYREGDNEDSSMKAHAKNQLERYLHYYTRFHGHAQAQKFARKQYKKMTKREIRIGVTVAVNEKTLTQSGNDKDGDWTICTQTSTASDLSPVAAKASGKDTTAAATTANPTKIIDTSADRDLRFLVDANQQLVNCRRVLKYTYVFAFYKFTNPSLRVQKDCFEHHQGILERMTEELAQVTENPELGVIDQQDVINRTRVIGQFIKNVLEYVDSGMIE